MSIAPATDLILDVMKAADPVRARQAAGRLKALSAARIARPDPGLFPASLAAVRTAAEAGAAKADTEIPPAGQTPTLHRPAAPPVAKKRAQSSGDAQRASMAKLEGLVLENMLNQMMSASTGVFGKGLTAEYWKSMLAGAIAGQIAGRGGLGLAQALVRRSAAPDGVAGAASALGFRQRFERQFLSAIDGHRDQAAAGRKI